MQSALFVELKGGGFIGEEGGDVDGTQQARSGKDSMRAGAGGAGGAQGV
jgi:hypothetical protein